MPERSLQLDDLRDIGSPEKIASLFRKLGYNAEAQPLEVEDLQLSGRSAKAINKAYLIADQGSGGLQVLLFQLDLGEWTSPSTASSRMKAIASQIGSRSTEFLLLATKDYEQLMLVNCRKSFDDQMNLKASIRKLLIDRTNPTAYDCDRLNEIAVHSRTPQELYKAQCEAFDVEKLTKQFYRGYKDLFEKVQTFIRQHNSHPYFNDSERLHQFSQRLLGRIMFLYFLQKKEFLGGDRKFLTTQYQRLRLNPDGMDYYAELLEPLFFDTLNNKQRDDLESDWGKIPYLNGGLFDRDYGEGIKDAAGRQTPATIELPNSLFDPGSQNSILGFFNGYNFTISENVQGDEDVAVDPEMLGKVFENMLAAEERGQSGTFYTPRGIVQFMCTEVLSRYLADESEMDLETVKKIIDFDPDQPDSEFNKLMTSQQARKLKRALEHIKVLDPAVGSGAFPLGMMQVILAARQAVGRREGETIRRGSLRMSQLKRGIIANNLYGVDIKPEAIEIAKLRMWLSLVVDIPEIVDVEPLPNLDYKLMCGDSLISTIHGEQLIPDPTKTQQGMLAVTPIQQAIQPLLELQHRYFDAQTEERHKLREQILAAEANVFRVAVTDRRQYWEGNQRELERKIKAMKGKPSITQEKEGKKIAEKLAELDKFALEVESGERSLNFFQYHLHFRDVFEEKSGFDVVIGNPPYLKIQSINKEQSNLFKNNFESATGKFDIYVLFVEKSFSLIKQQGIISYIHPHKFITADYGKGLKKFLEKNKGINLSVIFGVEQVFDSATTYSGVFIYSFDNEKIQLKHSNLTNLYTENYQQIDYKNASIPWQSFSGYTSYTKSNLIERITGKYDPLKNILRIYQGTVTGGNEIFVLDGSFKGEYFEGVSYALNCEVKLESNLVKPLLLGEHIRRYQKPASSSVVFYAYYQDGLGKTQSLHEEVLATQYPLAYDYIKRFKQILIDKRNKYKTNPKFWYCLHRSREIKFFENHKIITPQLQNYPNFTLDTKGWYTDGGYCLVLPGETEKKYNFLLGVLNSLVLWFFIKNTSHPYSNNYYYFKTKYLEPFSIPSASEPDCLAIEALVQKCLDAQGQDVEEWEAEIDDRVAHLYELTAEEMKIIKEE